MQVEFSESDAEVQTAIFRPHAALESTITCNRNPLTRSWETPVLLHGVYSLIKSSAKKKDFQVRSLYVYPTLHRPY